MTLKNLYNLYRTMENENVILSFKGIVTVELLTSVLNITESILQEMQEPIRIKKKVFNILVECMQNLYHHGGEHGLKDAANSEDYAALVVISKIKGGFEIKTGNYLQTELAEELNHKLNLINDMDREDLRMYYHEKLNDSLISAKGTAGLGMIDIARKSGNKLEYDFFKVDEQKSFFSLNVKID